MIFAASLSWVILASLISAQVLEFTPVYTVGITLPDGKPFRNFMFGSNANVYPLSSEAVQGPSSQVLLKNEIYLGTAVYSLSKDSSSADYLFAARINSFEMSKRPAGQQTFNNFSVIYVPNNSASSDVDIDFKHNLMVYGSYRTLVLYDISVSVETPVQLDKVAQSSGYSNVNFPNGISINKYLVCAALDPQGQTTCAIQCFDISTGRFGAIKVLQSANQTGCIIRTVEVYEDFIVTGAIRNGLGVANLDNPNNVFIWDRATFKLLRAIPGLGGWATNFFRVNNTIVWSNQGDYRFGAISLVNVSTAPYIFSSFTNINTHAMRWFGRYLIAFTDSVVISYLTLAINGQNVTQADTDQANYGYFTPTLALVNNASVAFKLSSGSVSLTNLTLYVRDTYAENSFAYVRYTVVKMPSYLTFANPQLSSNFTNAHLTSNVNFIVDPTLYSSAGAPITDTIVFLASNGRGASLTVTVPINALDETSSLLTVQTATMTFSEATTMSEESSFFTSTQGDPSTTNQPNILSSFITQNLVILLALIAIFFVVIVAVLIAVCRPSKAMSTKKGKETTGFYSAATHLGTNIVTSEMKGTDMRSQGNTDMKTLGNTDMPMAFPAYLAIESQYVRPLRTIGGGGAGSVFEAQLLDPQLISRFGCKKVALKVMDRDSVQATPAFQNEMIIMANFAAARNIAKVYGFLSSSNSLVMKLYEGTLGNWCLKYSAKQDFMDDLPLLVRDVACGLAELHGKKICHNDIKPANILIDHVDGSLVAVLTDFGIASFLETDMEVKALKPVLVKGLSLSYASPECLISFRKRTLDAVIEPEVAFARDVYALAMTTFECLCGNPFTRSGQQEIMDFLGNGRRPPFDTPVVPTFTDSPNWAILVDLVEKCWVQDPRDRPTAVFIAKYLN